MFAAWANPSPQNYSWIGQLYGHMHSACATGVEGPAGSRAWDTEPHPRIDGTTVPNAASQGLPDTLMAVFRLGD